MPSLAVPEIFSSTPKDLKKKKALNGDAVFEETLNFDSSMEKRSRKEKKSKKVKPSSESELDELKGLFNDSETKKKKDKKRKNMEGEGDHEEERSETSSESGEPVNLVKGGEKKGKKAKLMENNDDGEEREEEEHVNATWKFRLSEKLRDTLKEKGITYLFPIQAMTFDTILDGFDMVGRARTGQLQNLEVWFQRPKDIVRKLVSGDLDLGIVGLDTVTEYDQGNGDLILVHDALEFGDCRLSLAIPKYGIFENVNSLKQLAQMPQWTPERPLRVDTGFTYMAPKFMKENGLHHVTFSTADGALEAAPAGMY